MERDSKEYTLVLSVFKGVNFVVQKPAGVKCKIVCRVNESVLESSVYHLRTISTEPEFNYQAAWKLNKKELQELRLNREVVKIECHLLNKAGELESVLGYCTVSVKDAEEICNYEQIDVKNAKLVPLKGTKQPWIQFGPKLQLILHFEDPAKGIFPASKRKMVIPKSPTKKDARFKAPVPPPPPSVNVQTFSWSINNEMGYFQLGKPGSNDDLYVMNITLVSAQNLEHLLNEKDWKLEGYQWRIRFDCFGMTIDSDIFTLNCDDGTTRTYLGDKSTGRVRASEKEFKRFLSEFMLEMKVETVRDSKTELQGTAWTELKSITDPDVFEIRSMIDIVPEKLATVPENFSPQLSHIIDVKTCSKFFANYIKLEDISFAGQNMTTSKEDLSQFKNQDELSSKKSIKFEDESPQTGFGRESYDPDMELARTMRKLAVSQASARDENSLRHLPSAIQGNNEQKNGLQGSGIVVTEIENRRQPKNTDHSAGLPAPSTASTQTSSISASTTLRTVANIGPRKEDLPSPVKQPNAGGGINGASAVQNHSTLKECCPPGDYDLSLKFTSFHVKAKIPLKEGWRISFFHPPLSVEMEDRCELVAKICSAKDKVYTFYFDEDENENWGLTIPKFSPEILNTPLRINFYSGSDLSVFSRNESPVGYSDIPLGSIFTSKKEDWGRKIEGSAKISRNSDNPVKIGYLNYEFTLTEKEDHKYEHQQYERDEAHSKNAHSRTSEHDRSPELFTTVASESKSRDSSKHRKASVEVSERSDALRLDNEERLFKERLKEKEKAYLQMLSQEHKKQKEESEKAVNEKLSELVNKRKEYEQKLQAVLEKEENLKAKEAALSDSTRINSFESSKVIEELKLKVRRLEADKKIEVDAVSKRLDTALTDLEIANGKIIVLEKKLEAKEEDIFKLKAERGNWPEAETIRKIDKLQQENTQLKKELKKALEEKDHYRSQTQRIAKELQFKSEESHAQLRTENENLKLQMLASREHELLNKEILQVASVSHEIRLIKDNFEREKSLPLRSDSLHNNATIRGRSRPGDGDFHSQVTNGDENTNMSEQDHENYLDREIERLSKSREGLLKTQAYTPYDSLIRNIEAEILKHLQEKSELMEKIESKRKRV